MFDIEVTSKLSSAAWQACLMPAPQVSHAPDIAPMQHEVALEVTESDSFAGGKSSRIFSLIQVGKTYNEPVKFMKMNASISKTITHTFIHDMCLTMFFYTNQMHH